MFVNDTSTQNSITNAQLFLGLNKVKEITLRRDRISYIMIQNHCTKICYKLLELYNIIYNTGTISYP